MFFFIARAEKGIAWHIDASSVVWTLIYNGKLANQIAKLAAIVVKTLISGIFVTGIYGIRDIWSKNYRDAAY